MVIPGRGGYDLEGDDSRKKCLEKELFAIRKFCFERKEQLGLVR